LLLRRRGAARVEVLDLGGDTDRKAVRVESADPVDPALARDGGTPGLGRVVAQRRDRPEPGDDDSAHLRIRHAAVTVRLLTIDAGAVRCTGTVPSSGCSGGDALFAQRQLRELVPVRVELLRHRLLVLAVLARGLGGLFIAGLLRDPLAELVARDLQVLG